MSYFEKVKNFNKRTDYTDDIKIAKLLLNHCLKLSSRKKIFIIGTGLGGDIEVLKDFSDNNFTGIEPRLEFYNQAGKTYSKFGGNLLNINLGQFVKKSHNKLNGIFLFMHSINHIPRNELKTFGKAITNSLIIVINPNPSLVKIVGKTDNTVISYLTDKKIEKILNCKNMFHFFYNSKIIKNKKLLLREALLLKSRD